MGGIGGSEQGGARKEDERFPPRVASRERVGSRGISGARRVLRGRDHEGTVMLQPFAKCRHVREGVKAGLGRGAAYKGFGEGVTCALLVGPLSGSAKIPRPPVYELGVRVAVHRPGRIRAVRYFRPAEETGRHVGRVWDEAGRLLAEVEFREESASGWQSAHLAQPLPVAAGHYVVSVNCNRRYACAPGGMGRASVNKGPISTSAVFVPSDDELRDALAQLRGARNLPPLARPAGVTDVKLHRVYLDITAGRTALRILANDPPPPQR